MRKYVVFYLLLLPVGAAISFGISSLVHASLGSIPAECRMTL